MIDPVTIGIAFTAAQQSVNYIKKAIALGKDVNSLYGQFAKFFENSDKVHSANVTAQGANAILTDGQIRAASIQVAMHSKALRDAEKELKDLLIYTGNSDVWEEMMAERVRLYKERARLEREKKEAEAKAKADLIDNFLIFISAAAIIVPVFGVCFTLLIR
jgi:hypothetical protein